MLMSIVPMDWLSILILWAFYSLFYFFPYLTFMYLFHLTALSSRFLTFYQVKYFLMSLCFFLPLHSTFSLLIVYIIWFIQSPLSKYFIVNLLILLMHRIWFCLLILIIFVFIWCHFSGATRELISRFLFHFIFPIFSLIYYFKCSRLFKLFIL